MTSTKSQGWSINGDTAEDEERDWQAARSVTPEDRAAYAKLSESAAFYDPDSHLEPSKTAGE